MNLSHFPPEILAHILSPSDSSFLCIRLCRTGDRLLQHQLSRTVTSLDLRTTSSDVKLPSIVSHLHRLRHFAIKSDLYTLDSVSGLSKLHVLPTGLESLRAEVFQFVDVEGNYAIDTTVPQPILTSYPRGMSTLTELGMETVFMTSSFTSMLPRSLIKLICTLEVPASSAVCETAWFDAPPCLEYIRSLVWKGQQVAPSWLPKSITHNACR